MKQIKEKFKHNLWKSISRYVIVPLGEWEKNPRILVEDPALLCGESSNPKPSRFGMVIDFARTY